MFDSKETAMRHTMRRRLLQSADICCFILDFWLLMHNIGEAKEEQAHFFLCCTLNTIYVPLTALFIIQFKLSDIRPYETSFIREASLIKSEFNNLHVLT